jgi:Flp pilus assembly protein TadD
MVRLEIGEQRESLEDINLAIKYEPTDSQYYLEKAWILASLGRKPEAQSTLNAYLYREPHEANSSDVQKVRQKLAQ